MTGWASVIEHQKVPPTPPFTFIFILLIQDFVHFMVFCFLHDSLNSCSNDLFVVTLQMDLRFEHKLDKFGNVEIRFSVHFGLPS